MGVLAAFPAFPAPDPTPLHPQAFPISPLGRAHRILWRADPRVQNRLHSKGAGMTNQTQAERPMWGFISHLYRKKRSRTALALFPEEMQPLRASINTKPHRY